MKKFLQLKNISFFVIFFCFFISISHADDLNITQYPVSPRPGDQVTLTLQSDTYNLKLANISWTIDGQPVDSGIGRKTLTLTASQSGVGQVVAVNVTEDGYDPSATQIIVQPNTNFILYEGADSYVPSFYKGRRLPAKEGVVRAAFFSFYNGNIVGLDGTDNSNYTWNVNGQDRSDLSGQNKIIDNLITKVTDNNLNIKVTKEDPQGNRKITETSVPLQNTDVVFYKTDEKKILKQVLADTEIGKKIYLLVEPFFYSVANKSDPALIYDWKINDVDTKTDTPWSVVFTGKNSGDDIKINLDITNEKKITQEDSKGFTFHVQ